MMEVEAVMNNVALVIGVHSKLLQHEGRLMTCPLLYPPSTLVCFVLFPLVFDCIHVHGRTAIWGMGELKLEGCGGAGGGGNPSVYLPLV